LKPPVSQYVSTYEQLTTHQVGSHEPDAVSFTPLARGFGGWVDTTWEGVQKICQQIWPNGGSGDDPGIVVPGVNREWTQADMHRLNRYWEAYNYTHHRPEWWQDLWERSDCVRVETADLMPNGYEVWLHRDKRLKEAGLLRRSGYVEMLELDSGNFTFTRIITTKNME
jgi:hypothetical protein